MEANAANGSSNTGSNVEKKEKFNEEIKEFAETAMNELLGWYGYNTTKEELKVLKRRCHSYSGSNSSGPDSPKYTEGCGWCGKTVDETNGISSGTASFCSELCFSQSRRASFKKNKTCDWCRHVRHTVSYVDFQDGASQLQFCSDKCLNQYKMHIFCRETEAHLELHPHLPGEDKSGAGLITPDLWLKNCKSPDSRASSPPASPSNQQPQLPSVPLISVAPASKLMAITDGDAKRRLTRNKKHRKRQTISCSVYNKTDDLPQDLRVRQPNTSEKQSEPIILVHKEGVKPANTFAANNPLLNSNPRFYQPTARAANPPNVNNGGLIRHPADLPPVTVLVPYPIVVPFPVPIPIPIPLGGFLAKQKQRKEEEEEANGKEENDKKVEEAPPKEAEVVEDAVEDEVKNGVGRPLRKRKRLLDSKPRLVNKKKPLVV